MDRIGKILHLFHCYNLVYLKCRWSDKKLFNMPLLRTDLSNVDFLCVCYYLIQLLLCFTNMHRKIQVFKSQSCNEVIDWCTESQISTGKISLNQLNNSQSVINLTFCICTLFLKKPQDRWEKQHM